MMVSDNPSAVFSAVCLAKTRFQKREEVYRILHPQNRRLRVIFTSMLLYKSA